MYFISVHHVHTHNRRCSVQKGGSEGMAVRHWTSRPCWERWPAPGLPVPAGAVSSAAPVPLSHFPASPTPSAGLHYQTGPEKQEHATLRPIGPKLGIAQWCESLKLWSELIGTVLCLKKSGLNVLNWYIDYIYLHIYINSYTDFLCYILPKMVSILALEVIKKHHVLFLCH